MVDLVPFDSWPDVLAHTQAGKDLYYHAPMDQWPVFVLARRGILQFSDQIRVTPTSIDADPFWADSAHLSRFRRKE